eukprot:CAMPEP_0196654254 /NCGR_PEP_ID=MMETSP1086-20130531/3961_1 /TAXON_ID=77921 /ORGANISM="Cyanoptyche  gloeocystis , Strain SAG4.97" /LENGTH=118 /DNA_ID=CAMNT_0041985913 /DNA_START=65 /DNA_END=421 /DNA_ORIENTATION=+
MDGDAQKGIQQLLQAEQEASDVVARARKARAARIKQAADEAQQEIKLYRHQREEAFKKLVEDRGGSMGERQRKLEQETAMQVVKMKQDVSLQRQNVMKMLLGYITNVNVDLPVDHTKV